MMICLTKINISNCSLPGDRDVLRPRLRKQATYAKQTADDGEDDDREDGDDHTVCACIISLTPSTKSGEVVQTHQLHALRAETTGFMVRS